MSNPRLLPNWVNARASGQSITAELHVVGEDGVSNEYFLDELPEPGTVVTIASRTQKPAGATLAANEFTVDYKTGKITTHSSNDGEDVSVAYTAIGSSPLERDMDRIRQSLGPWNIDMHKPVAHALDDDFETSSLAGKWTVVTGTLGTVNLTGSGAAYELFPTQGYLAVQLNDNGTGDFQMYQVQTLGDNRSVIICMTVVGLMESTVAINDVLCGLCLNASATSFNTGTPRAQFEWKFNSATERRIDLFDGSTGQGQTNQLESGHKVYLRVTRKTLTYHCSYSLDGNAWVPVGSVAPGTAFTHVWLFCDSQATFGTPNPIILFDWIREGSDALFPW